MGPGGLGLVGNQLVQEPNRFRKLLIGNEQFGFEHFRRGVIRAYFQQTIDLGFGIRHPTAAQIEAGQVGFYLAVVRMGVQGLPVNVEGLVRCLVGLVKRP